MKPNSPTFCSCKVFYEAAAAPTSLLVGTLAGANLILLMSAITSNAGVTCVFVMIERRSLDMGFLTVCDWTFSLFSLCIHFVKGFGKKLIYI